MTELMQEKSPRTAASGWTAIVLWVTLLALILVAALSAVFALAVMPNLTGADDETFVTTLQRYNDNPVFAVSFTGALLLAIAAVLAQRRTDPAVAVRWTLAALVLHVVVFAITIGVNVPLNDEIDQVRDLADAAGLADVRARFEGTWVPANAVRTVLSLAAVGALVRALQLRTAR